MNENLAEKLLIKVMNWTDEQSTKERQELQTMARYKYDHYQQFSPGMRFVESLAQWLNQFESIEERQVAYNFIKKRLIFCSESEMKHLVSMAYPDFIRPLLMRETARILNYPEHRIAKIVNSKQFKILRRQSLFLGLTDGSHIDWLRRMNQNEISHEQTCIFYDVSSDKSKDLKDKLRKDLAKIMDEDPEEEACRFRYLFLLDDFSGSGTSYLREKENGYTGKIYKVFNAINNPENPLSKILDLKDGLLCIMIYMGTEQAINHLKELLDKICMGTPYRHELFFVQYIPNSVKIQPDKEEELIPIIDKYYDPEIETDATKVGRTEDVKMGYAKCALPLVLSHNTPNNSIALLWSHDHLDIQGLFPRITRH